jgi:hypothetical protein
LLLGHNKANTSGLTTVAFQSGARHYQVLGASYDSFGAKSAGHAGSLDVRGKVKLLDVTDPWRPVVVASGLTLRVTATDVGFFGKDAAAITLTNGEKLLFSSDWTGAKTAETQVSHGTVTIL